MLKKKKTFFFNTGVTSSGFPFEFGRNPYKGKRPLKDIIGSYKNRHSNSDPLIEGTSSGSSGGLAKPVPEMQLQIQSQQEELEQLKKDLSSQKVTVSRCLCTFSGQRLGSKALAPRKPFPEAAGATILCPELCSCLLKDPRPWAGNRCSSLRPCPVPQP